MKNIDKILRQELSFFSKDLTGDITRHALFKEIPAETVILKEGDFIRAIPLVLEGLLKVYSRYEDRELLLYYIQPYQSCIMSFSSALSEEPSRIFAETEEDTHLLLLPVENLSKWIRQYPEFNTLFYHQYNIRYNELLDTIRYLLYHKLDQRILNHLVEKSRLRGQRILDIRHKQIAFELGTAREVVSRLLKKLEKEGKLRQTKEGIEILVDGDESH